MLLTVLILLASVIVGIVLNLTRSAHSRGESEGETVVTVLNATALLAGLLIAIVLAGASESYAGADDAAKSEADTVDNMYESAEYMDLPGRQAVQAAAVCYARAVVGPEWDAMATGEGSRVPSNWTGAGPLGIRRVLIDIGPDARAFDLIQAADQTRGELRSERLRNAKPSVPAILTWFMVVLIGLSLAGLAYSIPRKHNRAHIVALVAVTLLFALVLLMIYNFDRPFSSVLALEPTAMHATADDIDADYEAAYRMPPPCDEQGVPLALAAAPADSSSPSVQGAPPTTAVSAPQTGPDTVLSSTTLPG